MAAGQDGDFAIGSQKMFFSLPGAGVFTRRSYPKVQFNFNVFNCIISVYVYRIGKNTSSSPRNWTQCRPSTSRRQDPCRTLCAAPGRRWRRRRWSRCRTSSTGRGSAAASRRSRPRGRTRPSARSRRTPRRRSEWVFTFSDVLIVRVHASIN